jgi:hypothetical protein
VACKTLLKSFPGFVARVGTNNDGIVNTHSMMYPRVALDVKQHTSYSIVNLANFIGKSRWIGHWHVYHVKLNHFCGTFC